MDGRDLESDRGLHGRFSGLLELLRDAHGGTITSHEPSGVRRNHPQERKAFCLDRKGSSHWEGAGNPNDMEEATKDIRKFDVGPIPRWRARILYSWRLEYDI